MNSAIASLALGVLLATFWIQLREARMQRHDRSRHGDTLAGSRRALQVSAEANMRMLHMDLLKLAIDDEALAEVWPVLNREASPARNRQYLYANLIIQHTWLALRISDYTEAEIQAVVRYLFTSSIIREFWHSSGNARNWTLIPDTEEFNFVQRADAICQEYETVLNGAGRPHDQHTSPGNPRRPPPWQPVSYQRTTEPIQRDPGANQ